MLRSSSEIVQIKYFEKRKMYWINASEVGQVKQFKSTTAQVKGFSDVFPYSHQTQKHNLWSVNLDHLGS